MRYDRLLSVAAWIQAGILMTCRRCKCETITYQPLMGPPEEICECCEEGRICASSRSGEETAPMGWLLVSHWRSAKDL